MYTHTHTHTNTRARTHTHARAHTHTQVRKGFVEDNEESSWPQPIVELVCVCVCLCIHMVCVYPSWSGCVCVVCVCVCVVCVFCVNPCSVRYRVHGGVCNSQPSIDQDVRMREFRFRVQNVWCWVQV
jgi:hypothetical protein